MSLLDSNIIDRTDRMALGAFILAHQHRETWSVQHTSISIASRNKHSHMPLPDNVIYDNGTIHVLDQDLLIAGCNGIDPKWGVTGFTARSIIFKDFRGNFTTMRRLEAQQFVKIIGHIGNIEDLNAKAHKITLGCTWVNHGDVWGWVKKCKFDCDHLYIRDDIPKFFMCDIKCREVTIHDMNIFETLTNADSEPLSHPISNDAIKEHIIEGRKYNSWKKLRALINNPKRHKHLMPENPDEWLNYQDDKFPILLGLVGFKGLQKINIQDSDIGMSFVLGADNLWHVKKLYQR